MVDVPRSRAARLGRGAATGALAYLTGYLLTWVFAGSAASRLTVGGPFGGSVPDWRAVLWLFYDSHFVGTRTPDVFGPDGGLWVDGELVDTVALVGAEYLYALPVALLFLAGVAAAALDGASGSRAGLRAGVTVASGYLLLVVVGLLLGTQRGVAPSPLRAVLVAGVLYPVALGGLGGLVAGLVSRAPAAESGDPTDR
jgi:hypothetical protein